MNTVFEIIICFIAGMGAGLGTGFAGLSAAAVQKPAAQSTQSGRRYHELFHLFGKRHQSGRNH